MATVAARPITAEEFLAIEAAAGDDVTLELINGEIREYPNPMTTRSPRHSTAIAHSSYQLIHWLNDHLTRDGDVAAGEVRCRISRDPNSETRVVARQAGGRALQAGSAQRRD